MMQQKRFDSVTLLDIRRKSESVGRRRYASIVQREVHCSHLLWQYAIDVYLCDY
jgi:hypothetical protein